ncbi:MAG TPA: hypothetical protein VN851_13655 [Thermoanaerobaculia bacterium]|nr:hypothetical protein [Thermoanaerobaculia bacterium]
MNPHPGVHRQDSDEATRDNIARILSGGLETEWQTRADDSERFQAIVKAIRASDGELTTKLRLAGFTDHPITHFDLEQSCETCMYFQLHHGWCVLPELDLPVRPEWSCNVWRI